MTPNTIFLIANNIALVAWLLLIFAPRWRWTRQIVISGLISLLFAIVYLFFFILGIGNFDPQAFSTLEGVMQLFTVPEAVLVGWLHYLAFDLFVGTWEVSNAQRHNVPHGAVIPCLIFTFMAGPVGLLLYFIVRGIILKKRVANF